MIQVRRSTKTRFNQVGEVSYVLYLLPVLASLLFVIADLIASRFYRGTLFYVGMALLAVMTLVSFCIASGDYYLPTLILLAIVAQRYWRRGDPAWLTQEVFQSVTLLFLGATVYAILRVMALGSAYSYYPSWWGLDSLGCPLIAQLALLMLFEEIVVYWIHRMDHTIGWLWSFHKLHHAPVSLNVFATDRDHPWFTFVRFFAVLGTSYAVGVAPHVLVYSGLIRGTVSCMNHWDVDFPRFQGRWPWWAFIVSTPNYHAWHHTIHCRRGANLVEVFPLVDALFGTLEVPRGDSKTWEFGLGAEEQLPETILGQVLSPFGVRPRSVPALVEEAEGGNAGVDGPMLTASPDYSGRPDRGRQTMP